MLEHHLEKLLSFHFAAQELSFLRAARLLKISQPAITKNIKFLEDLIKEPLFARHRRGVDLTPKGKKLFEFTEYLYLRIADIESKLNSKSELSGVIRIGTYETLGDSFWPKVLKSIAANSNADLQVELVTEPSSDIWSKLESGAVDLVVDAEPTLKENLLSKIIYTDHLGVFCKSKSKYLVHRDKLPIALVKKAFDKKGDSIEFHLQKYELDYIKRYDLESFTMVRSFLLSDLCIGVLPLRMAKPYMDSKQICYYPIKKQKAVFGEHRICATMLVSNSEDSRLKWFIKQLMLSK